METLTEHKNVGFVTLADLTIAPPMTIVIKKLGYLNKADLHMPLKNPRGNNLKLSSSLQLMKQIQSSQMITKATLMEVKLQCNTMPTDQDVLDFALCCKRKIVLKEIFFKLICFYFSGMSMSSYTMCFE